MYNYTLENVKEAAVKFWKKTEKQGAAITDDDIKEVVRRAFRDLTVRTMQRLDKQTVINLDNLADGATTLHETIKNNWLENPECDFSAWHKESCDIVKEYLENYYQVNDCTYGKAQKIVNMSLKNLYALCCARGIINQYETQFEPCHLPLDSFTLEWFYRACKRSGEKTHKCHISNWSAIKEYGEPTTEGMNTYADGDNTFYDYISIQIRIAKLFEKKEVTPLQAEFIIWPNIQFEIAAEEFYAQLCRDMDEKEQKDKKKEFAEKSLDDKKKTVKQKLEETLN